MSYSLDLRKIVIGFINNGGNKAEAARIYNVGRSTIYTWLQRSDLTPTKRGPCDRKLSKKELAAHVEANPYAILRERAVHFGVRTSTIWAALQKIRISKKNDAVF
jgi:putative transposase